QDRNIGGEYHLCPDRKRQRTSDEGGAHGGAAPYGAAPSVPAARDAAGGHSAATGEASPRHFPDAPRPARIAPVEHPHADGGPHGGGRLRIPGGPDRPVN